ncbi:MAG: hypothetical protein LBP37_04175 [Spirochaetaceae bacterium]|nr:hypothetical protein [Spirochaetaceae bacterium]
MGIGFNIIGRKVGEEIKKFTQLIFEARKDDKRNAFLYDSPGEDSVPLDEDRIILVKVDGAGKYAAVGVLTPSQGAKPGEKIFFARDPDGAIVSKISMLNDGAVNTEADGDITSSAKKNINLSAKENFDIKADKNTTVEAAEKATLKGADVEINGNTKATGGSFECAGTVAPTGQGALCACKYCYVTGAAVAGSRAEGT